MPQGLFQWERIAFGSRDLWSGLCVFQFKTRSPSIIMRFFPGLRVAAVDTSAYPSRTGISAKQVVITVINHCHSTFRFQAVALFQDNLFTMLSSLGIQWKPIYLLWGSLQFANPFCALGAVTCGFLQYLVWPGRIPVIYLLINTSHSSCNLVFSILYLQLNFSSVQSLVAQTEKFNHKKWSYSLLTSGLLTWLLPTPKSPFIAIFTRED